MTGHTAEPWRIAENKSNLKCEPWTGGTLIEGDVGTNWAVPPLVAAMYRGDNEANARRIVACINACAGIPTEALERAMGKSAAPWRLDALSYWAAQVRDHGTANVAVAVKRLSEG